MSLRIPHLTRFVARTTRPFFTPTANQTPSLTLLNNPVRRFSFYRRSVCEDDVAVVPADKIPRLPLSAITQQHPQNLWVGSHHGLSEAEYKDIAGQDPASESSAASTASPTPPAGQQQEPGSEEAEPALYISMIYKPPLPKFPGIQGAANIDVQVYSDEDMLPVLVELRDADHRIKCVFEQPEIIDAIFYPSVPGARERHLGNSGGLHERTVGRGRMETACDVSQQRKR
ncbi:hypothetical protein KC367_g7040 [Hortaea werneckii]|nr:hypothetical protein KC357_g1741 [Hortaea werneckii]KAI7495952.1 hypothetical protein KC367_g7040 [Hortaea werneckii]